jgi:hypothetical protein
VCRRKNWREKYHLAQEAVAAGGVGVAGEVTHLGGKMENNTAIVLSWISAIGAITTPFLLIVVSAILANVSKKQEKVYELQAKLQDDRLRIYNSLLEPFIIAATPEALLSNDKRFKGMSPGDAAGKILSTTEYKQLEFKLLLIGSDSVIKAYSEIKKYFFSGKFDGTQEATAHIIKLEGNWIVEIRKSVGNEDTKVTYRDTAWYFVKDAEKII